MDTTGIARLFLRANPIILQGNNNQVKNAPGRFFQDHHRASLSLSTVTAQLSQLQYDTYSSKSNLTLEYTVAVLGFSSDASKGFSVPSDHPLRGGVVLGNCGNNTSKLPQLPLLPRWLYLDWIFLSIFFFAIFAKKSLHP